MLTEQGLAQHDAVIQLTFHWLRVVGASALKQSVWETRARVSQLVFNYTAQNHVLGEASTIAANMQIVPWQYSLATAVLFEQDADATQRVLRKLAPDNCIVFLVSKDFESIVDQTEK